MGFSLPANWELLLPNHAAYKKIIDSSPRFVVETYLTSGYSPSEAERAQVLNLDRIKHLKTLYILEPNHCQLYWTAYLHQRLHVQLSKPACDVLVDKIEQENARRERSENAPVKVVVAKTHEDLLHGDTMDVFNNLDPQYVLGHMGKLCETLQHLLAAGPADGRQHRRLDLGTCGTRNPVRCPKLGLVKPQRFAGSSSKEGKQLMAEIGEALKKANPTACENVFNDPERQAEFANNYTPDGVPGFIEAGAVALQMTHGPNYEPIGTEYINPHLDTYNDKKDEAYMKCFGLSFKIVNKVTGEVARAVFLGYGKQACYAYMVLKNFYGGLMLEIRRVHDELPTELKTVTPDLIPPCTMKQGRFLQSAHVMKLIHYSIFVRAIKLVLLAYPSMLENGWFTLALIITTQVSNRPQYFYHEVVDLIKHPYKLDKNVHVADMEPLHFGYLLYSYIFDVAKRDTSREPPEKHAHLPPKCWKYKTNERFQTSNNRKPTQLQVHNSIKCLGRVCREVNGVDISKIEFDPRFYFHVAVDYLSQDCEKNKDYDLTEPIPKSGLYGCKELFSQHVLMIASLLRVLPVVFSQRAQLADGTGTTDYLKEHRGLSENFPKHAKTLMEATEHALGLTQPEAEECWCKLKQWNTNGRRFSFPSRYCDWVPPGAVLCVLQKDEHGHVHTREMYEDGRVTELSDIGIMPGMERVFEQYGPAASKYWTFVSAPDNRLAQKVKNGPPPPRVWKLYGRGKLDVPNPQKIIESPMPEHRTVLEPAITSVTAALSPSKDFMSRKKYVFRQETIRLVRTADGGLSPYVPWTHPSGRKLTRNERRARAAALAGQPAAPAVAAALGPNDAVYYDFGGRGSGKKKHKPVRHKQVSAPAPKPITYYLVGVLLPDGKILYPDKDFVLRMDCFTNDQSWVCPKTHRRYFADKEEANHFASYYFIFNCPHLCVQQGGLAQELLTPPTDLDSICHKTILAFKVIPYSCPQRKSARVKSRLPRIVCITYKGGGYVVALCDECGNIVTDLYPVQPASVGIRTVGSSFLPYRYTCILAHQGTGKRTQVQVRWCNGETSWENLCSFTASGTHWHVFHYSVSNDLSATVGWRRFNRWKAHNLGVVFMKGENYFDTIVRMKFEEADMKVRHQWNRVVQQIARRLRNPLHGLKNVSRIHWKCVVAELKCVLLKMRKNKGIPRGALHDLRGKHRIYSDLVRTPKRCIACGCAIRSWCVWCGLTGGQKEVRTMWRFLLLRALRCARWRPMMLYWNTPTNSRKRSIPVTEDNKRRTRSKTSND